MKFPHPGPGKQLTQAGFRIGRFQQFGPYVSVVAHCLPSCFNDGVARCMLVHNLIVHEGTWVAGAA